MRPSVAGPTGTLIGAPGPCHIHAAAQAVGGVHGHAAHPVVAQVLLHFQDQTGRHRAGPISSAL